MAGPRRRRGGVSDLGDVWASASARAMESSTYGIIAWSKLVSFLDTYCTFLYLVSLFFRPRLGILSEVNQSCPLLVPEGKRARRSLAGPPALSPHTTGQRRFQRVPNLDGSRYRFPWPLNLNAHKEVCRGSPQPLDPGPRPFEPWLVVDVRHFEGANTLLRAKECLQ